MSDLMIPLGLETALEEGNAVLFLGAGIGHYMVNENGEHLPDAWSLACKLAKKFGLEIDEDRADLAQVATVVQLRHKRQRLIAAIRSELDGFQPTDDLKWLVARTWKAIFTTNYDNGIEIAYSQLETPTQTPVAMGTNSEIVTWDPSFQVPVFHLHGYLFGASDIDAVLITEEDYSRYQERRSMLFDQFKANYPTSPILYIGYSNRDSNWREVTTALRAQFFPSAPPRSFRLAPNTPELEREILESQGIETIDGKVEDFRAAVTTRFGDLRVEPASLSRVRARIPSNLQAAFDQFPTATSRLINSWEYVNQADFSVNPNTESFLKGDRPNWGVIGKGQNFERDLERPIVDALFDFATQPSPRAQGRLLLGPAGYGTTTLLMAIAAWYAKEDAGPIFMLKPEAEPTVGDIEFAISSSTAPPIFVVDNGSEHHLFLTEILAQLRSAEKAAYFLVGSRLNEWRQVRSGWNGQEFIIDPLSDDEIDKLILALSNLNALGRLTGLSPALRHAAIKDKNQQQLLVTMREVTEGQAFDSIIESEFHGINDSLAKDIYSLICGISRVRVTVRDGVISDAVGIQIHELYSLINTSLVGIVVPEVLDESRNIDGLRARHQMIADIVWERCLNSLDRESVLTRLLDSLNLTFGADARAFRYLTQDSDAVGGLRSFDARLSFFERAIRKDPDNPYIRQQFALMLRRENKLDLALVQIEKAIEMSPRKRVLYHTKGLILRDLAIETTSREVARRWLAQAEGAFAHALSINDRDEYSYQSLASLYLDWAKKSSDENEAALYLTKSQEALSDGFEKGRELEYLYVLESKIQDHIGNTPGQLNALRRALEDSPSSANVRYILGSALRRAGELDESRDVLYEGLVQHPGDSRLALAYVQTLLTVGREASECASILALARVRGLRDPAFTATYAGLLVLAGDEQEAQDVLNQAAQRGFSSTDRRRTYFVPADYSAGRELNGSVVRISQVYAFVRVPGFGDFFLPPVRFREHQIRVGDDLVFEPAFSVRGPVVHRVVQWNGAAANDHLAGSGSHERRSQTK